MSQKKTKGAVYPKPRRQPVAKATPEIVHERFRAFTQLFPEALTEGKLDWDKLKDALGEFGDERPERYSFSWAGKRQAIQLLQTPSRATLVPAPKESVNFDATQHLFIEGDNLEVLKLLYKAYFGQVKMIFIDPPYNTGNDFIYPDNFADPLDTYLKLTGQKTAEGNLLTSNPETSGRYHSAWLSMMYPRLFLARQLLRDDGVIFVSIDDHEVHNLRLVMNEVFGEECFLANIVWQRTVSGAVSGRSINVLHDHILCYAKRDSTQLNRLEVKDEHEYKNPDNDPRGPYKLQKLARSLEGARPFMTFTIQTPKGPIKKTWGVNQDTFKKMMADNRIGFSRSGEPYYKQFLSEYKGRIPDTWWDEMGYNQNATRELQSLFEATDIFDNPKPVELLRTMLRIATDADSVVLDFFAGSATTAQAVLEQNREDGGNRRFIMVQLPEQTGRKDYRTIAEIGKERIRRVIKKLAKEKSGELDLKSRETPEDLGFRVFKLAESNFRPWPEPSAADAKQYAKTMELYNDPLQDGWQPVNVLHEVAIKEGYGLTCRIEKVQETKDLTLYRVIDADKEQSFYLCLDDKIALKALKPVTLKRDDLFICRDTALTDEAAANLALQCRLKTI